MRLTSRELIEARAYMDAIRMGTQTGLELLGSGIYGRAYRLPSGKVLKYARLRDVTCGYIAEVAKMCAKTGAPPRFAPMVWHFEPIGNNEWWAIMEYVRPAKGSYSTPFSRFNRDLAEEMVEFMRRTHVCTASWFGVDTLDDHSGNWGWTEHGRVVCFDPDTGSTSASLSTVSYVNSPGRGRKVAQWKRTPLEQIRFQ
jgi:hypothetical protein